MVTKPEGWKQDNKRHWEAKVLGKASPSDRTKPVYGKSKIVSKYDTKTGTVIHVREKAKELLPSMEGADASFADDLNLFEENDRTLQEGQVESIRKNYLRYMKRSNYDHNLAVRGIINLYVPNVVKKYNQENGTNLKIDKATARLFAEDWVKFFEVEAKLGNYDYLLEKN